MKTILEEANELIYGDRQAAYGTVTNNFGNISKGAEVIFKDGITPEKCLLFMIWVKICRQLNKPQRDNIIDIGGYAGCIDKLQKGE